MELKSLFCELLRSVNRSHTEEVITELERIGFFESPASSKEHLSYPCGLVEHSLNVYRIAKMLAEDMASTAWLPLDRVRGVGHPLAHGSLAGCR